MTTISTRAEGVLRLVRAAAEAGRPAPTNAALALALGLAHPEQAREALAELEAVGLVAVEQITRLSRRISVLQGDGSGVMARTAVTDLSGKRRVYSQSKRGAAEPEVPDHLPEPDVPCARCAVRRTVHAGMGCGSFSEGLRT